MHEVNKDIEDAMFDYLKFKIAENEAFKKAGIKYGKVEFTCPLCGGKAIGNRYKYYSEWEGRYKTGGLGSGCSKCGIKHS